MAKNPRCLHYAGPVSWTGAVSGRNGRVVEVGRFGVVGVIGLAIDLLLFNLALFVDHHPMWAKIFSGVVSSAVCYFLNRHWTWRHRGRTGLRRELPLFIVASTIGLAIAEGCLVISHYTLGLTSKLDDNISANVVGLILATLFRFWAYKRFVFLHPDEVTRREEPRVRLPVGTD